MFRLKIKIWILRRYINKTQSDLDINSYELTLKLNKLISELNRKVNRKAKQDPKYILFNNRSAKAVIYLTIAALTALA